MHRLTIVEPKGLSLMPTGRRDVLKMMVGAGLLAVAEPILSVVNEKQGDAYKGKSSVVINGAVAVAFRQSDIYVFAPELPDPTHPGTYDHYYRLDCTDWQGTRNILNGPQPNAIKRLPRDYGLLPNHNIIVDCDQYGFNRHNTQHAGISLPFPDQIYPMRLLNLKFASSYGSIPYSKSPGALVFEYMTVTGTPTISGSSWPGPGTGNKWMLDISVGPHSATDPGLVHAKRAWAAVAKFFPDLDWTLQKGRKSSPGAPPTPDGITDFDIESVACTHASAANCKLSLSLVLHMP
jgi:hypothetical protein